MEKTGEMDLYMYVDGRGRMTMPRALRCRTGMGKNSFVRARLYGSVVRLTHVTPREAAQMTEEELLDFIRDSIGDEKLKQVTLSSKLVSSACCLTSTGGFTLEMEKYFRNGPSEEMRKLRADRVLELNGKHAACLAIKKAYDDGDKDKAAALSKILYAQSELIAGVEIEDPTAYADLVCSLF